MTNDITAFIEARLGEWERLAREATGATPTGNWWVEPGEPHEVSCLGVQGFMWATEPDAAHIAAHDPAQTLALVGALRKVVAQASQVAALCSPFDWPNSGDMAEAALSDQGRWTLRRIASIWRGHEDWREEWA